MSLPECEFLSSGHTMRFTRFCHLTVFLASLGFITGCSGSDPKLVYMSGTVTVDGKPLPHGMLVFEPDPAKGNRGQQGHANIKNGQFDTRLSGKGVALGAQVVRITGGDGVNPDPVSPFGALILADHESRIEVTQDQPPLRLDILGQLAKKKPWDARFRPPGGADQHRRHCSPGRRHPLCHAARTTCRRRQVSTRYATTPSTTGHGRELSQPKRA